MGTSTDELKKENDEEKGSLIDVLIKRCNHISDNVRHAREYMIKSRRSMTHDIVIQGQSSLA